MTLGLLQQLRLVPISGAHTVKYSVSLTTKQNAFMISQVGHPLTLTVNTATWRQILMHDHVTGNALKAALISIVI